MIRSRLLVVHSGRYGQSEKIARFLAADLENWPGCECRCEGLAQLAEDQLEDCQGLVMVTSVHYGRVVAPSTGWALRHRQFLSAVPTALAVVSLSEGRRAGARSRPSEPALHGPTQTFLAKTGWRPDRIALVEGALEYPKYSPINRRAIHCLERALGRPTDLNQSHEYTDWDQVARFGRDFAALADQSASR
ncbi:MAG: hypothetical protein LBS27_00585 [Bifidobacteriaceae bacterium]|jgi:menaquinone-dependent protoporphyrinogen oxidase|nr:hypothetical protein [Bifidobacteriaceae bacterium]